VDIECSSSLIDICFLPSGGLGIDETEAYKFYWRFAAASVAAFCIKVTFLICINFLFLLDDSGTDSLELEMSCVTKKFCFNPTGVALECDLTPSRPLLPFIFIILLPVFVTKIFACFYVTPLKLIFCSVAPSYLVI
jgi:hypothetical protein